MAAVSSRYARAFADVVLQRRIDSNQARQQLHLLAEIVSKNDKLRRLWESPALPAEKKRDVLDAIAQGLDNNEIAASLGMSEKTVRNHVTRVLDKIGAEHRYQAIVLAREAGLGLKGRAVAP